MNRKVLWLLLWTPWICGAQQEDILAVDHLLTQWHQAASDADFEAYFGRMATESVFIGTDAAEYWNKAEFMAFSKPYFDKGKAWSFSAVERHIYLSDDGQTAWFDELLDTWMQLCRGSGVAIRTTSGWKIAHYVLSLTIPNETVEGAIALKRDKDSITLSSLRALVPKH